METNDKIQIVFRKILFKKSSHNEIYASHLRVLLKIMLEDESGEWKNIKYKSSTSCGIGERYIKQYFKGLVAWGLCDLDDNDCLVWKIEFHDNDKTK